MRLGIALLMVALMLVGCSSGAEVPPSLVSQDASTVPSVDASNGTDVPPDDPSRPRVDADGRTPDEVVLALIDAQNKKDWRTAYSFYAEPPVDLATASREWAWAEETCRDFRVLEVRVARAVNDPGATWAWVRVVYDVTVTLPGEQPYRVTVQEPGQWWAVFKIDGRWKLQWMPGQ
ncbi:MAG: hypothetical protein Q7W30_04420 [Coriobacteriia bacterium]|nr:hypothetical protein [Coriobacteriia bacterium]